MFCQSCGKECADHVSFCPSCGARVYQETQQTGEPQALNYASSGESERTWAMACHLAGLCQFIFPMFGGIVGSLIVWLIKKDQYPLVNEQGKEALNFQITVFIYAVISFVLMFVFIGFLMLAALLVFDVVMIVIAAVRTNAGEPYRYPLTIRLIA